ncbi:MULTISPECIES: TetR/AcrR family transcriptional regulator [Limosilactobacillus]|uniref:TetR/AcrR family transcriptional regulator C-terminal domain-containing protein n=2 Tax=Limosilactobacillus TaxID=2742598 RepID=A0A839H6W2_9LACO|nr:MULTISPECIES: TetR/AcrR family transcriptional regulator [Limosilactobacillus]MRH45208.1 TetR family transcriptional regulator [Limosilactobacillus reuteri]MBB1124570.1 TetR/AcrR family transcriptional regulator C-terminal domain-containing protein [Limosilactobacillus albertensis]MCD7123199.1 TetR/AcrR family transcriptional regulator [Limosilactobacillus albertensis]MCD7125028.1 TetR/AcrR family transcriptional regulator [Limosilactobacillus caviae]GGI62681.1 TetR family transcriptional r
MSDRRVNRTKRQIKESFIKLLSEKEISRITVSEITEQADIGRGTFYTHYQDIYDLYQSLINELAQELLKIFDKYYSPAIKGNNFIPLFRALSDYVSSQQQLFSILINKRNNRLTISYLQDQFKQELINYNDSEDLEYIIGNVYGVSGIFGIFIDWLQGKIKASPEQLGEAIGKFANKYWFPR